MYILKDMVKGQVYEGRFKSIMRILDDLLDEYLVYYKIDVVVKKEDVNIYTINK